MAPTKRSLEKRYKKLCKWTKEAFQLRSQTLDALYDSWSARAYSGGPTTKDLEDELEEICSCIRDLFRLANETKKNIEELRWREKNGFINW